MIRTSVTLIVRSVCAALVVAVLPVGARAEDAVGGPAAKGPPPLRAKISQTYLDSLVGEWDLSGAAGDMKLSGHASFAKGLDGTAIVEHVSMDDFFGFGVGYLSADGKTYSHWWFDSQGSGGAWPSSGPINENGYVLSSVVEGKPAKNTMKKTADGHEFTMVSDGELQLKLTYKKAAKAFDWGVCPVSAPKSDAALDSILGDWVIAGQWEGGGQKMPHTGTSSYRRIVGGHYVRHDYVKDSMGQRFVGLGVSPHGTGDKPYKMWWFNNYGDKPIVFDVTPTGDGGFTAKGESDSGPMDLTWKKAGDGFAFSLKMSMGEMTETYTRKK